MANKMFKLPGCHEYSAHHKYDETPTVMKFKRQVVDRYQFRFEFEVWRNLSECCQHNVVLRLCTSLQTLMMILFSQNYDIFMIFYRVALTYYTDHFIEFNFS
jgi:hypothetical protein